MEGKRGKADTSACSRNKTDDKLLLEENVTSHYRNCPFMVTDQLHKAYTCILLLCSFYFLF